MRVALLTLLIACGGERQTSQPELSELDQAIEENWKLIKENQKEIDELLKSMDAVATRATEIRRMVDCTVAALDSKMSDRDQVLTINECFREAGYRP